MEEYIVKIKGIKSNCASNICKKHLKFLYSIFFEEFYTKRNFSETFLELVAAFTFAIIGDFDTALDENNNKEQDIQQTRENLEKLERYFIAESIQNKNTDDLK